MTLFWRPQFPFYVPGALMRYASLIMLTLALLLVASFAAGLVFGRDTAPSAKPARQW